MGVSGAKEPTRRIRDLQIDRSYGLNHIQDAEIRYGNFTLYGSLELTFCL